MPDEGVFIESQFRSDEDVWKDPEECTCRVEGRSDDYITTSYDVKDGTYSLTYHPLANDVTTNHFTQHHAVLALRDAGYAFPQIVDKLKEAYEEAMYPLDKTG